MDEQKTEISADTPIGKFGISGGNVSNVLAALSLMILGLVAWGLWQHQADARAAEVTLKDVIKEMVIAQREATQAQREMNCLISLPADKREREFMSDNSLCKRISR